MIRGANRRFGPVTSVLFVTAMCSACGDSLDCPPGTFAGADRCLTLSHDDGGTSCVDEVCNGLDDDCDDTADEDFGCVAGETLPCETSCESAGTRLCSATCVPDAACAPPAERCNAEDDDCDDLTDEGLFALGEVKEIAEAGTPVRAPRIAWLGDDYGVVFVAGPIGLPNDVLYVRLDGDGDVVGEPAVLATGGSGYLREPWIASDGPGVLVTWMDAFSPIRIWKAYFDADDVKAPVAATAQPLSADERPPRAEHGGPIAAAASGFGVTFVDGDDVAPVGDARLARVDALGAEAGAELDLGDGAAPTAIAYDAAADAFVVGWIEADHVRGRRVGSDGTLAGPAQTLALGEGSFGRVDLGWTDGGGLAAFVRDPDGGFGDLFLQRLGDDLVPAGAAVVVARVPLDHASPPVSTGRFWILAHVRVESGRRIASLVRTGSDAVTEDAIEPLDLSTGDSETDGAALAWTGREAGVVWTEDTGAGGVLRFARYRCVDP